ncbi:linearmycin resistance ATP-binding protein LnrL-like [Pectinophora gossypiella]|uniref:linearmycin resistance ATP-binding protein LnrL-like n=1 Tax=Pectinophora gossypiella TaxID=13191 RepID=UPI00214E0D15|nr:linearmycin resistance ATP-binding protein LnrL-like [Pectinophora gossypiella]
MVSGFLVITRGRSCINGFYLKKQRRQYIKRVSSCAADGMDEFLSGYKNLKILAALHGHSRSMSSKMAMSNLNYMGLTTHAHQLFSSYSSGCSHRLAVAKSLISEASAVLLDEPCGSVDPHTRPLIVRAIRLLRDQGAACLIAEESMDWTQIDYICDRLAIIDKGEIVAIGSVEEIRRELTSGYTATLKLKVDEAYRPITESLERLCSMGSKGLMPTYKVSLLKREFLEMFETSILIDEHIIVSEKLSTLDLPKT